MTRTLQLPKRSTSPFLAQYKLERKALKVGARAKGTPSLRIGTDEFGNNVLVRVWQRDPSIDDIDLRDIWRNETRQLHRLAGYPGVSNYIAQLVASSVDDLGYYLVLSVGQRLPLQILRDDGMRPPRSSSERRLAWGNLLRIAKGLEILHLQGLLHRNLNMWSILTAGDIEPDFQLTGFEWSMRLVGQDIGTKGKKLDLAGEHSFTADWAQFGAVAREIFDIPQTRISDRSIPSHDVLEGISADEIKVIRELTQVFPLDRVDGLVVADRIEKILMSLSGSSRAETPSFYLILPFGQGGPAAAAIREASDRTIETDDAEAQERFVQADLASPTAMLIRQGDANRLALRGERLTYKLVDYVRPGPERRPTNWDYAYTDSIDIRTPLHSNIVAQVSVVPTAVNIMPATRARQSGALRGRTTSWSLLRRQLEPKDQVSDAHNALHRSLLLSQLIDYLLAAADTFPIEFKAVANGTTSDEEGRIRIEVRARVDDERIQLSKALGLRPPEIRLKELLNDDRFIRWTITDLATIGDRSDNATEWQFEGNSATDHYYTFSGDRAPIGSKDLFLVPSDSDGRDQQLRRRMKSFEALSQHAELCDMLVDPRIRVLPTHDSPVEDNGFKSLDTSKQSAFTAVVGTLPLFMVQGPPGVGKTRLVRELVRQTIEQEPATRLLLSAQSNHAVDHLLKEIEGAFAGGTGVESLVVRCLPKEKRDLDARFDVSNQARNVLTGLLASKMYEECSEGIRERLNQLAGAFGLSQASRNPTQVDTARRTLERLVLHSANLVFATTNSSDLERLIDERNQFDWSIVEEAGKATGGELISPLLLSPRRLMIGDHQQLPPFGADRVLALLATPSRVKEAMKVGDPMIGWQLRDASMEELLAEVGADDESPEKDFTSLCDEAASSFLLFETLVEAEFDRIKRGGKGMPIAARLDQQHRMHPTIGRLVSHAFYDDALFTDEEARKRFQAGPSPLNSSNPQILPDCPVVWIDMPWTQNTMLFTDGEKLPRYLNGPEVSAVSQVLSLLRARSDAQPTLSVLSPYSRQVTALGRMIESQLNGPLSNLSSFSTAAGTTTFSSTVDSFQGNEADCVVVSLVRNNAHGNIGSALGFLANSNRMNVLLSRAKHKLIVIGSLSFLKSITTLAKSPSDQDEIRFLKKVLEFVDNPECCAIVPFKNLGASK